MRRWWLRRSPNWISAWRLREPLHLRWTRQPTIVYLLAATAVLLGEVLPRFDIVATGESWLVLERLQ